MRGKRVVKEKVTIDGHQNGWFLVGNPQVRKMVLFLHGGPGSPEFPIFENELLSGFLDEKYAVCYLDFLGSGLSFTQKEVTEDMLIEQVIQVAAYLKETYQLKQLVLMGHSYGSYIGIKVLQLRPAVFSAYYGISQVIDVRSSEEILYQKIYQLTAKEQTTKILQQLTKMRKKKDFPTQKYVGKVKGKLVEKYHGGMFFDPDLEVKLITRLFLFQGYTFFEKLNYLRGLIHSNRMLFPTLLEANLFEGSLSFDIPVYFIHGEKDLQVSKELVIHFFDRITSSKKELIIFSESAHFPHLEEKEKFMKLF
ncbi:alpha/beta fold hydrolase [Candidatus Enterococcus huntleyi]|uniref:alpha/beta fold hydrolase n=1 Tax=Candidatus Enterococcus huntleyi TaxID=1857217 RepID=UPI00137A8FDF|nr:alpha/beta hydrolase [Enterococcus sp. JM4C]